MKKRKFLDYLNAAYHDDDDIDYDYPTYDTSNVAPSHLRNYTDADDEFEGEEWF